MNNSSIDANIPLLTEVIPAVAASAANPLPARSPVDATSYKTATGPSVAMPGITTPSPAIPSVAARPVTVPVADTAQNATGPRGIELPDAPGEKRFPTWTEKDLQHLENILNERVLRQVQSRVDFVLEHRIRDSLADALQVSIDNLTAEIKRGLRQTLEDVISRAVAQELARLQALKK